MNYHVRQTAEEIRPDRDSLSQGNAEKIVYRERLEQIRPDVISEVGKLKIVVAAHADGPARVDQQLRELHAALAKEGIDVVCPGRSVDTIFTRDLGFVIGDTFFISNFREESRKREVENLDRIIEGIPGVIRIPRNLSIEGGDVIVEGEKVYIGVGNKTDPEAASFVQDVLPQHKIIPVRIIDPAVLHLDCAFVPLEGNVALLFRRGIEGPAERVFGERDFIEVTKEEQGKLATNVLSISPDTVIVQPALKRVNDEIAARGFRLIKVPFDHVTSHGGSFRCATLPLNRDRVDAV